ncbi:type I-C CRISPR-associated protein Cas7/Csd2 [Desulfurivibrio sp. C05AmB]|uniref:type I-C CRISPR-associated protein Cas7/Csd2 n=1 Tax=Desulfurivibrio sp. C05AmB TaxID=3374371 RepID=UPI00376EF34A
MGEAIKNRYEFVLFFDVKDGNPNGDPDAGNLPRIDPETGNGLVTDVCLKRKVRNYVGLVHGEQPPNEIYVKEKAVLNRQHERAYHAIGEDISGEKSGRKGGNVDAARAWMCGNFFDVRTFGAVMSTGINCGQVRGPVQFAFGRSVDRIFTGEHSITRMAVATEAEAEKQGGDNRTMGRKFTVPYGLYRVHGFISAPLAKQTGFSEDDLQLFWDALVNMFDHDRSAARGEMAARKLFVFRHEKELGNAPASKLFDLVKVEKNCGDAPPRAFTDYQITVGTTPAGVELIELL